MKVVPLSEAKAQLSRYGRVCQREPVVVTVNGKPSFQLVPLAEDDDLIDRLLERHRGFREMLQRRLAEPRVSATVALARVGQPRRHSTKKVR
jgi:prevent-host-death family protein